ncbi:hypothetical protein M0854_002832 [Salmonella enterica]|nr:hypothetical protein [Salmonella enterica]
MKTPKTSDFFVKRLENAAENMLIALNHYSYSEAVEVLEWLHNRVREESVIKMRRIKIKDDRTFPLRTPPRRRLVYSVPDVVKLRKLPG